MDVSRPRSVFLFIYFTQSALLVPVLITPASPGARSASESKKKKKEQLPRGDWVYIFSHISLSCVKVEQERVCL